MEMNEQMMRVCEKRKADEEGGKLRHQEISRRRLFRILEKKLKTSFVGALAKFETYFGSLWGHGLDMEECTPEQRRCRELWDQCRTEVLNNGNNQLRAVESEVLQYDISWHRFTLNLPAQQEEERNG